MILHLFPDEKFIDAAIDAFELVYPGQHKYVVGLFTSDLKFIKKNIDQVLTAQYRSQKYIDHIGNISLYEAVVIHYLDSPKLEIIQNASENVRFVWISWGGDIYNNLSSGKYKLYGKNTDRTMLRSVSKNVIEYYLRTSFFYRFIKNMQAELNMKKIRKTTQKIKYFSTIIPLERHIIEKHYHVKSEYVAFNYGSSEFINSKKFKAFELNEKSSKNILLGNSAAPSNNHFEVFDILSKLNLGERKVITPLSYGANANYVTEIKKHGIKFFKQHFFPLDAMRPVKEYYELISSCSICIMNHYRQNGMGNVIFMLWIGAKVFLSERNSAYSYFKSLGVIIYSIEKDLTSNSPDIFDNFSGNVKENNRKIIEEYYDYDVILKRTENFINVIVGKKNFNDYSAI